MSSFNEFGLTLKIATAQPIGVISEAELDPANMSSGSAGSGEVLTADGVGGASWSTESGLGDVTGPAGGVADNDAVAFDGTTGKTIKRPTGAVSFAGQDITNVGAVAGHVPTTRAINDGTGISGGGDLSADRTLSVDESALDPANQSSGAATLGQLPTAQGGGAIAWSDPPSSINLPGSSTDEALVRWNGITADTIQDSGVTLSDAGAMTFPAAGSITKPGTGGATSEAFGTGAVAASASSVALGNTARVLIGSDGGLALGANATVQPTHPNAVALGAATSADGSQSLAAGYQATAVGEAAISIGWGSDANVADSIALGRAAQCDADGQAIGKTANVYPVSSGDSTGAISLGNQSGVGNSTPGAGCEAAIAIGEFSEVAPGSVNAIAIGHDATVGSAAASSVAIGVDSTIDDSQDRSVALGHNSRVRARLGIAIGSGAQTRVASVSGNNNSGIAIGVSAAAGGSTTGSSEAIAIGNAANVSNAATRGIAIGTSAFVVGNTSTATSAIAIGESARVDNGDSAIAMGYFANNNAENAIAIGDSAKVNIASTSDNTGAIALGASAVIGGISQPGAEAAIAIGEGASVANGATNSICIGAGADVPQNQNGCVVIGHAAEAGSSSVQCVAIGDNATVGGVVSATGGIAIGKDTEAEGIGTVCIGVNAKIHDDSSGDNTGSICIGRNASLGNVSPGAGVDAGIAIGELASVKPGGSNSICIGYSSLVGNCDSAIAIGDNSQVGTEFGAHSDGGIAIGDNATVNFNVPYAVCLGADSTGAHTEAVAIGRDATTTAANRVTFGTIAGSYDMELQCGKGLGVFGVTPPASQPTKISDPAGGATVDSEARTAINALIDALEGAGITAAV